MTLPFRRRHHDAEGSHDRARSLVASGFVEDIAPADAAWLEGHLGACPDCRAEADAYAADRELLRSLRDRRPEPPRDLWARTAAAIEHDGGRHGRTASALGGLGAPGARRRPATVPLGVLSGVLVVLVVVGTALIPDQGEVPQLTTDPPSSGVAVRTPTPANTPLPVTAQVPWVRENADGTYQLLFSDVSEVCTDDADACAPLDDGSTARLVLPTEPEAVVMSPNDDQVVVVAAQTPGGGGEVIVVAVPTPVPTGTPLETPTIPPTSSPSPGATPSPDPTPSLGPGETPGPTPTLDPLATPDPSQPLAIVTGVVVVGEAAYSGDGQWLAFSARPIDGSAGPDLYLWHVGDFEARPVTSDGRTFFAGWLDGRILASRVEPAAEIDPGATPDPAATPGPEASPAAATTAPTASPKPARTPKPRSSGSPSASPETAPATSPETSLDPSASPAEDRAVSFLLDPETGTAIELAGRDIWHPIVDPTSRTIVYWAGTVKPDADGTSWVPATGQLVLDAWVDPSLPPVPDPSASAGASAAPTRTPNPTAAASLDPLATAEPTPPPGPAGTPEVLAEGPMPAFEASYDPTGSRLAIWIADAESPAIGTLRLVVIDTETGAIDPDIDPLPGVAALRGVSIDEGRLAWVTPPGQDGDASHIHVLAWTGDEFGQVRSIAADRLLVAR